MKKKRPIHFVYQRGDYVYAACDLDISIEVIEILIRNYTNSCWAKGTIDPKKVTCKRCLKHRIYKEALDKTEHPLFYWKENI